MKEFTLVSTVFNEAKRLLQTIADLEAQSLQPSEIIITDAGSTDNTWEILNAWKERSEVPIFLLKEKGCNVSRGRNLAIAKASFDFIASTDFGCRFQPDWLKSIIEPFEDDSIQVVGGAFSIRINEELETAAAKADYILQNGYPVVLDEYFSVSSRSIAYKKNVWTKIGGYEEWLTLAADDTIFWRLIRANNFKYVLVDKPYVSWMRHRTYKAFSKEAYRYGLGDGESGINLKNTISHLIETDLRYFLFLFLLLTPWLVLNGWPWALLIGLPGLFGLRSYKNAWNNWRNLKRNFPLSILISSFFLIEYSRWYYLKGYLKGFVLASSKVKGERKRLQRRLWGEKLAEKD